MIETERLEELAEWKLEDKNLNVLQMIVSLLMGEMRDMAKELIVHRRGMRDKWDPTDEC